MKKEIVSDGVNATSGILSIVNPIFSVVPLFVFGINRVIELVDNNDIIKRIKKFEAKLKKKKIDIDDFKNRMNNLDEHERFVLSKNLNNILLESIPEVVDVYISIFIDYVYKKEYSFEEELFETISSLNNSDIKTLRNIYDYFENGEKEYYKKSIKRLEYINKINENTKLSNEISKAKNIEIENSRSNKIKYLDDIPLIIESNDRYGELTVFWKDFCKFIGLDSDISISKLLLFDYYESNYSKWTYLGKSFIKLDKLGLIEMEYLNYPGCLNSLNVDRFHVTYSGIRILEYFNEK